MKSLANRLLKVSEAVLKDYVSAYPTDKTDVMRDLSRLTRLVENRGIGLFTLSLPELDSILLDGLELGRLVLGCPLSKKAGPNIQVPRLFRGIWLRIFDVSGSLREDSDPTAIFFLRQLCCVGKSIEVGCTSKRTKEVLDEYRRVESSLHTPTLRWHDDDLGTDDAMRANHLCDGSTSSVRGVQPLLWDERSHSTDEHFRISNLLRKCQRNFDAFASALGNYDPESFTRFVSQESVGLGLKHGPGAVADLTKKEFKYDFPYWPAKLEATFPFKHFGCTGIAEARVETKHSDSKLYTSLQSSAWEQEEDVSSLDDPSLSLFDNVGEISLDCRPQHTSHFRESVGVRPHLSEPFSRLIAVPKTAKGPRLIAAEPTAHQWCQQLTARFLVERANGLFRGNLVTINDQEPSKRFASYASLTGKMATVDLSSASDRLSCWLVERAFRSNPSILRALHSHRTRGLADRISYPPVFFKLKKFATQGTAVTFPVQSYIFLIIALTASGFEADQPSDFLVGTGGKLDKYVNQVRVFGDDIIIPKHGYDDIVLLLHTLGLKVNTSKSFASGNFRESCGGHYFKGYDVTPLKTKSLSCTGPTSRQSLIDYSNNLFTKGLWNAAKTVELMIPSWIYRNMGVTRVDSGGFGLTSFVGSRVDHLRWRWNAKLQRKEVRTYTSNSRVRRKEYKSDNAVLQYFAEAPSPDEKWVHGLALQPKTRDGLRWEFPHWARDSVTGCTNLIG
jgi:hypothetical protein